MKLYLIRFPVAQSFTNICLGLETGFAHYLNFCSSLWEVHRALALFINRLLRPALCPDTIKPNRSKEGFSVSLYFQTPRVAHSL